MATTLTQDLLHSSEKPITRYRWMRVLFVLFSLCLLGSCSTARLGYSNADTLAYWWMDSYVDFNSSQKAKVKRDIVQLLSWHRTTQLSQYAQTLTQIQAKLAANPSQAEIETVFRQVEQFSQAILLKAVPELTDFLLTMDESQTKHLARKFEKNNEEFRDKYLDLTPEKQAKERRKKFLKQVDEWLGSISREQEAVISRFLEKHPPTYAQWLDDSVARQRLALQLVKKIQTEKPNRELALAMVQRTILAAFEPAELPEHRAQTEASRLATQQLVLSVIRTATPDQKTHAIKKLQNWIDDCQYLIAKK